MRRNFITSFLLHVLKYLITIIISKTENFFPLYLRGNNHYTQGFKGVKDFRVKFK
jgi:hypothetical protein